MHEWKRHWCVRSPRHQAPINFCSFVLSLQGSSGDQMHVCRCTRGIAETTYRDLSDIIVETYFYPAPFKSVISVSGSDIFYESVHVGRLLLCETQLHIDDGVSTEKEFVHARSDLREGIVFLSDGYRRPVTT